MKNFKYKALPLFIGPDGESYVLLKTMLSKYPRIEKLLLPSYSKWEEECIAKFTEEETGKIYLGVPVQQFEILQKLYERICLVQEVPNLLDVNEDLSMYAVCSVCDTLLPPDIEAYTDEKTGEALCDTHAKVNEETGNYTQIEPWTEDLQKELDKLLTFRRVMGTQKISEVKSARIKVLERLKE